MTARYATAGKGGVGKTTFTALFARAIVEKSAGALLVVDADPNANLNEYLGVSYDSTVADARESLKNETPPAGMSKPDFTAMKISQMLSEHQGFDLLTMGHPEGPGCYCFVNEILRSSLSRIGSRYSFVLTDNEAGLEHLSRRTTDDVDRLFVVSDPSRIGLVAALRIKSSAENLKLKVKKISLVLNRIKNPSESAAARRFIGDKIDVAAEIPEIPEIPALAERGGSVFALKNFPSEPLSRLF